MRKLRIAREGAEIQLGSTRERTGCDRSHKTLAEEPGADKDQSQREASGAERNVKKRSRRKGVEEKNG
jgi:hypothetical protein